MFPRVLIISNNAINMSDSNGRTIGSFFQGWEKQNLMQFCLNGDSISEKYVNSCYRISDKQMLKAVLRSSCSSRELHERLKGDVINGGKLRKVRRRPSTMVLREILWTTNIGKTDLYSKARNFSPQVVLLQLGDATFMINLALKDRKSVV